MDFFQTISIDVIYLWKTWGLFSKKTLLILLISGISCFLCFSQSREFDKANTLLSKGKSLLSHGKASEAENFLLKASETFKELGTHEEYVESLLSLARRDAILGDFAQRGKNLDLAILACEEFFTSQNELYHKALSRKGRYFMEAGNDDSSKVYYSLALSLRNVENNPTDYVWNCIKLSQCFLIDREIQVSDSFLKIALDTCMHYTPNDFGTISNIRFSLGENRVLVGDKKIGLSEYEEAIHYASLIPDKHLNDTLNLGIFFAEYASVYIDSGETSIGIDFLQKGINLFRKSSCNKQVYLAPHLSNLGYYLSVSGQHEEGLRACMEARKYLENPQSNIAIYNLFRTLGYIISILLRIEPLDKKGVEDVFTEAFQMADKFGFDKSELHSHKARFYRKKGEVIKEVNHLKRVLENFNEANSKSPVFYSSVYGYLGSAMETMEKYDSALVYFQKGLQTVSISFEEIDFSKNPRPEGGFYEGSVLAMLGGKASVFREMASSGINRSVSLRLAHQCLVAGNDIADHLRNKAQEEPSKREVSRYARFIYEPTILVGKELFDETDSVFYLNESFVASEKSKSLLLLDSKYASKARGYSPIPSDILSIERELKKSIAYYNGHVLKEKMKGDERDTLMLSTWQATVFDLKRELEAYTKNIHRSYPEYISINSESKEINLETLEGFLKGAGETLVEYFLTKDEFFAFLINGEDLEFFSDSIPSNFNSLIFQYTQSLNDYSFVHDSVSQSYNQYTSAGHELYQLLLEPVLKDLPPQTKLIIVPDGPLSQIPFEALLTERPQPGPPNYATLPYLLKKHPVRYAYSAALLLEAQNRPAYAAKGGCLALAPSYKGASATPTRGNLAVLRDGDAPLEGAQLEVQALSELGMPGEFLMGDAATEETFKALAPSYNLLHLALHGQADSEDQLNSSIRFAATPGDTCQDDLLHAYEMYAVPLKADLVVLSACESGVGEYLPGEGVMSLARHFMAAGASSVVMTQWQVEDQASAELMGLFYKNIKDGMRSADALHQAKLSFLQQADSRTAHPFYWAGYIANGASKRLPMPKGWAGLGLVMGTLGFGLAVFGVVQWKNRRAA